MHKVWIHCHRPHLVCEGLWRTTEKWTVIENPKDFHICFYTHRLYYNIKKHQLLCLIFISLLNFVINDNSISWNTAQHPIDLMHRGHWLKKFVHHWYTWIWANIQLHQFVDQLQSVVLPSATAQHLVEENPHWAVSLWVQSFHKIPVPSPAQQTNTKYTIH